MRIKLIGFEKYDVIFAMKTINVKMEIGNDKKTRKIVQRNTSIEILRFFEELALIGIEYQQNNELKKEFNHD